MNRARFIIFFSVLLIVPTVTYIVIQLARGYRPDFARRTIRPTGLLHAESSPTGAKIWVSGKLVSATNSTVNLDPGIYNVKLVKEGFHPWEKTLRIEKELVTQIEAWLIPDILKPEPVLSGTPVANISLSEDRTKLAFVIPRPSLSPKPTLRTVSPSVSPTPAPQPSTPGVYILDLGDLPFNLNRNSKLITLAQDIKPLPDWSKAILSWSPDSRSVLARLPRDPSCIDFDNPTKPCSVAYAYLLETGRDNSTLTNILATHKQLLSDWRAQTKLELENKINKLPKVLIPTFTDSVTNVAFSPDNTKVLYVATASATLPEQIIAPIPAANSQPQERLLQPGRIYVYDLHEDRNFAVGDAIKSQATNPKSQKDPKSKTQNVESFKPALPPGGLKIGNSQLAWLPTSRHILEFDSGKVHIKEYDNTNKVEVLANGLVGPNAYPSSAGNRLFVLLNTPENPISPQLFSITLKP